MTESRWPNDYDRKFWTWPKNSLWLTLTFELDQKYNKYYHNDEHYRAYTTKIIGQVQRLMFIGVNFESGFNINIRWCEFFSVIF